MHSGFRMYQQHSAYASCFRCGGKDIFTNVSLGDVICRDCGEVLLSRIIDESSEWNVYANDDRGDASASMRASLDGRGETVWSVQTTFVGGTAEQRASLQKAQMMSESKGVVKAAAHLEHVTHMASQLHLPSSITAKACEIFSQAVIEKLFIYLPSKARLLAAACVFLAGKATSVGNGYTTRTLTEIAVVSEQNKSAISKYATKLATALKIDVSHRISATSIVPRLCALVKGMSQNSYVIEQCRQTCSKLAEEELLDGVQHSIVASVAILCVVAVQQLIRMQVEQKPQSGWSSAPSSLTLSKVSSNSSISSISSSSSSSIAKSPNTLTSVSSNSNFSSSSPNKGMIDIERCLIVFADFCGCTTQMILKSFQKTVGQIKSLLPAAICSHKALVDLSSEIIAQRCTKIITTGSSSSNSSSSSSDNCSSNEVAIGNESTSASPSSVAISVSSAVTNSQDKQICSSAVNQIQKKRPFGSISKAADLLSTKSNASVVPYLSRPVHTEDSSPAKCTAVGDVQPLPVPVPVAVAVAVATVAEAGDMVER